MNYRHKIYFIIFAFVFRPLWLSLSTRISILPHHRTRRLWRCNCFCDCIAGHMLYRHQMSLSASAGEIADPPTVVTKADLFGEGSVDVYPEGTHVFEVAFTAADAPLTQSTLTVKYQGCSALTCFMPTQKKFELTFAPPVQPVAAVVDQSQRSATPPTAVSGNLQAGVSDTGSKAENAGSPDQTQVSVVQPDTIPESSKANTAAIAGLKSVSTQTTAAPAKASESSTAVGLTNVSTQTTAAPVQVEMSQQGIVDFSAALEKQGIHWVLLLAFIGGLLVSLTPCVYPMIPITLSIIGSRDENVSFYKGLGLSATYVAGFRLLTRFSALRPPPLVPRFAASFNPMFQGLVALFSSVYSRCSI